MLRSFVPVLSLTLAVLLAAPLVASLAAPRVTAQTLELVATATFPLSPNGIGGSDVWGYTAPDGTEYALFGVYEGIAVVQVPSMQTIGVIPGPQNDDFYYHRDIVVHGSYAYAVSENYGPNEGLQVIDLRDLPHSVALANVIGGNVVSSHNMDVDGVTGYLYVLDSGANGVQVFDTADPANPSPVHYLDLPRHHDVHARGDTLYVAEGNNGTFSIWDVSDKTSPLLMTRVNVPASGYVHNIWPTDDGRHVLTTEETGFKTVKVWDIADVDDVQLVGEYLGPNNLAHNVHVQGDYAFLSHYESGVVVLDISDPAHPVEVDRYDTYPGGENPQFNGAWGATVPSPAGYVYGGDFDGKLTVLRFSPTTVAAEPGATDPGPTEPEPAPRAARLEAVYPNPARETAAVRFTLDAPASVRLTVLDALGREVARLADGPQPAGVHARTFDGAGLPSGLYVVRLEANGRTTTRRLSLLR